MEPKKVFLAAVAGLLVTLTLTIAGCISTAPTPTATALPPGGGALVNSDSIVTAKIQAIRKQTSGYPWEIDVLIQRSVDVGTLPNPTKDSVGKIITVKTDQDISSYKVGEEITAKVKYVGDVPKPGITLYMYDIASKNLQSQPEFIIKALLVVFGTLLIAGGIVAIVRSHKARTRTWGAAAIAAGVLMWTIVLLTTIMSRTIGG